MPVVKTELISDYTASGFKVYKLNCKYSNYVYKGNWKTFHLLSQYGAYFEAMGGKCDHEVNKKVSLHNKITHTAFIVTNYM